MARLILINKPYGVQCKFTDAEGRATLADYVSVRDIYAAGRLDADSEGLVVLTDAGWLQHAISEPRQKQPKVYYVQVEGVPTGDALAQLSNGILLPDGPTLPAQVESVAEPGWLWPRQPPIRVRKSIPTAWIRLTLVEGRNRQVRRMTASVGFPTLRLIRSSLGPWSLDGLELGVWREVACPRNLAELARMAPA